MQKKNLNLAIAQAHPIFDVRESVLVPILGNEAGRIISEKGALGAAQEIMTRAREYVSGLKFLGAWEESDYWAPYGVELNGWVSECTGISILEAFKVEGQLFEGGRTVFMTFEPGETTEAPGLLSVECGSFEHTAQAQLSEHWQGWLGEYYETLFMDRARWEEEEFGRFLAHGCASYDSDGSLFSAMWTWRVEREEERKLMEGE